jgi:hypothetical protein
MAVSVGTYYNPGESTLQPAMPPLHTPMPVPPLDPNDYIRPSQVPIRATAPAEALRTSNEINAAKQEEQIKRLLNDLADLAWVVQVSTSWIHQGHFTVFFNSLRSAREIQPRVIELIGMPVALTTTPNGPLVATREARIKRLVDDIADTLWILAITTLWAGKKPYEFVISSFLSTDEILPRFHKLTDMPLQRFRELISAKPSRFSPALGPCATYFALMGKPIAYRPDALPVARWSKTTTLSPRHVHAIYPTAVQSDNPDCSTPHQPPEHDTRNYATPVSPNFASGSTSRDSWMLKSSQGADYGYTVNPANSTLLPHASSSSNSSFRHSSPMDNSLVSALRSAVNGVDMNCSLPTACMQGGGTRD